jgi:hypothetical protein
LTIQGKDMGQIDERELGLFLQEIDSMVPVDESDFSMGYHTCLIYLKKWLMGQNPFESTYDGHTITENKVQ